MAKRFTVQKRARMRVAGWRQAEKQWAWDASEYVGEAKPFKPAKIVAPKEKARDLVQDGNGHYRPRKSARLASGGTAPRSSYSPVFHATDWDDNYRVGQIYRNGAWV